MEEKSKKIKHPLLLIVDLFFFVLSLLYHELLLHFLTATPPVSCLQYVLPMALAMGFLYSAVVHLIPWRKCARIFTMLVMALWAVLNCIEFICKMYYKTFFGVGYILSMSQSVATGFGDIAVDLAIQYSWYIGLALLPLIIFIIFRKSIIPSVKMKKAVFRIFLPCFFVFQLVSSLLGYLGANNNYYTYNYSANTGIPRFGLCSAVRLEGEYAIFGTPTMKLTEADILDEQVVDHPEVEELNANTLDINFKALSIQGDNTNLKNTANYISTKKPSQKNAYTGMFEGKNLITICAESFSYGVINETATPMLYKMTHEGFVFNNFYQPNWTQSTTGGEFSVMTGLIPTWINDNVSMYVSARDSMPYALGNMFRSAGYTTTAWHDNTYNYYNRDVTHPNLGYDYYGQYNGLTLVSGGATDWPASDLEMAQVTLPDIIAQSKESGDPFHTYYMSVSGHGYYNWGQHCASKNRDVASQLYPQFEGTILAYCSANLELEYMLEYIYNTLDEAGVLENTVICLCPDHYPYALIDEEGIDYYDEFIGFDSDENDISRYKNTFLLYCASMNTPIVVNTPCSAIDIAPTLYNLFGLDFDSRLLSGHDIFATNYTPSAASSCMPLVILHTDYGYSWITSAGVYDAKVGTFTANAGITVSDNYVNQVNKIIDLKFNYARLIIEEDFYNFCTQ